MKELVGGKVALIVNVASKCGLTPQYEGLQKVYDQYKDKGFVVIGFPCNQFDAQEPGTEEDINNFACTKFKATFPLMKKIDVNGANTHPLYQHLKKQKPGVLCTEGIKWNFTKFLVDRNGKVVTRYAPTTSPETIARDIAKLL